MGGGGYLKNVVAMKGGELGGQEEPVSVRDQPQAATGRSKER